MPYTRFLFFLLSFPALSFGQNIDSVLTERAPIDINFLFNYYEQDGNHSAVTGGIGTEELQDYSTVINILVPMDSSNQLNIESSINVYSSASTDNIDARTSSASSQDLRSSLSFNWNRLLADQRNSLDWKFGASVESDYLSLWLGMGWTHSSKDQNRVFSLSTQLFFDRWILYFPAELRNTIIPTVDTDKRRSYNLSLGFQQVINKRLNASLSTDLSMQKGFLSTPFHRVYFQGETLPRIEHFPDIRWKVPLGLRLNYFATDLFVMRFFYRYYWDSFGIQAHTVNLEVPVKLNLAWTVLPFYRYHRQSAADFFLPFGAHIDGNEFYTSDFDLSALSSHKFGVGLRFFPLWQLSKAEARLQWEISAISLRFSHYRRSDGLKAWSLSTLFSLSN